MSEDIPTTPVAIRQSGCIAATVNGMIVSFVDNGHREYVYAMVYAFCQYSDIKLVDADIKFYTSSFGHPGLAESLATAKGMWQENEILLADFQTAKFDELLNVNEIFTLMDDFKKLIENQTLDEVFANVFGDSSFTMGPKDTEVQVRTSEAGTSNS